MQRGRAPKLGMNMLLWSTDVTGPEHDARSRCCRRSATTGSRSRSSTRGRQVRAPRAAARRARALGARCGTRRTDDNPISADPRARPGLAGDKAAVDVCAALGARTLCGPLGAPLGVFSGAAPTDEEARAIVRACSAAAEHAATREVTIAVEYLNRFEMYLVNCAADAPRSCARSTIPTAG